MASSNNVTKNNTANNYAAVSRYATAAASSGWGGMPSSLAASITTSATSTGVSKTLADYVKESAAWQSSLVQQQQQQTASGTASLPWAAAIKAAEHQQQLQHLQNAVASQSAATGMAGNAFETRSNAMGSWCAPETSSSHRGGWGGDGSIKGDGTPDDGTAIWGNPSVKKTGVDWTEKESLMNPPQVASNNLEKRATKPEPTISSINGTEAWGAPPPSGASNSLKSATNSQQQSNLSDNSGNTYVTKTTKINNEPLGWGESSSLQGNNESSSPPTNSIWNNLASNGKQKSTTDWLSSSSSTASSSAAPALASSRIDELNKQLESTSIFDSMPAPSLVKEAVATSSSMANNHSSAISSNSSANNLIGAGAIGGGVIGSNSMNDLKQMGANFSNDLHDSSGRSSGVSALSSGNNQQSQLNTYNLGIAPSRDLLKQMVHQIQLAVQAGHLNAQILNQPMSTPTLQLVYTLLQQIRMLQQLQDIQQRTVSKTNDINPAPNNLDLQINRIQQNISLLQKAITQQQAALTKNDSLVDKNTNQQQQAANNFSYANISKLSTNMKVPPSNISNLISNTSIDGFKRGNLIDTLAGNSNSDPQRSAHAAVDANAASDKNLAPLLQSSAMNNRAQSISSGHGINQQRQQQNQQQVQKSGLLAAQSSSSSSSSASSWLAFNSSDLVSSGWNRISPNISQQDQQFSSDMMSDFVGARGWRDSSLLSDCKEASGGSLAPGANVNIARPNSASNNLKQVSETNEILSKNQSSFYDWGNNSDSLKRNFDSEAAAPGSSFSPSAIGGLSSQSNPWLFAPTSTSLNSSGLDNLIGKTINSVGGHLGKLDNGNSDKMGGDALNFLRSTSAASGAQRSSAPMYNDWGSIDSANLHFNVEHNPIGSKPASVGSSSVNSMASLKKAGANSQGARPAPPPGILGGFGASMFNDGVVGDGLSRKPGGESSMQARDSSASLWNGAWLD